MLSCIRNNSSVTIGCVYCHMSQKVPIKHEDLQLTQRMWYLQSDRCTILVVIIICLLQVYRSREENNLLFGLLLLLFYLCVLLTCLLFS